ncbi:MAG: Peptidyl-prolyl isomerase [Thermodesulfobacteria bacterium]|nr:peptidylprolyl isomerase [Thermodesulfobacteriota bacterium]MCU4137930.1 Peptidyl-prolyl isomerase [Thermodesulfobacteriota bacterium]
MKNLIRAFVILLFIGCFCSNVWSTQKKVLAEVGPYKLYKEDVEDLIKKDTQIQKILESKPELRDEIVKILVNRWVNLSLLALAGKKEGLDKDPEVKKELMEIEKSILAKKYFEKKAKKLNIKEREIKEYYKKNKERYKEPEGVHVKHILIYIPKDADKATEKKALEKAKQIRAQILKGAKFEELAKIYSDDAGSKKKGGDLGIIKKGQTIPEFEKVIFKLKPGEISRPIRSSYGYHIVKVEEKIPEKILPFEEVKDLVKKDYLQTKQEELMTRILQKLYQEYQPKIYLKLSKKDIQNEGR